MVKMTYTNDNVAFDFALFMIASSYFDKVECKNTLLMKSMFLQYREQKLEKQYQMEDICIKAMNKLSAGYPEELFKQGVRAYFETCADGQRVIRFVSRGFILELHGAYRGKNSVVHSRLWTRA